MAVIINGGFLPDDFGYVPEPQEKFEAERDAFWKRTRGT